MNKPNKNKHIDTDRSSDYQRGRSGAKWVKGINCMVMDGS